MNSATNRYSCRLPSASSVLVLSALLFFVLCTGTSALIIPRADESNSITHIDLDVRAHGYWRSEEIDGVQYPIVAYISNNQMKIYGGTHEQRGRVCDGSHHFVRLLTLDDYNRIMADSKPSSGIDPFPLISKGHVRDRLKVQDIGQGTQEHRHVELIRTVSVPIICIGMDHARCCGYWQPTEKDGVKVPSVAYISSDAYLYLEYGNTNVNLKDTIYNGEHIFVRIKNEEEFHQATGIVYDPNSRGPFPQHEGEGDEREGDENGKIWLHRKHATIQLTQPQASGRSTRARG